MTALFAAEPQCGRDVCVCGGGGGGGGGSLNFSSNMTVVLPIRVKKFTKQKYQ